MRRYDVIRAETAKEVDGRARGMAWHNSASDKYIRIWLLRSN